jgi:hypothetical protein
MTTFLLKSGHGDIPQNKEVNSCPFCGGGAIGPHRTTKDGKRPIWEIHCARHCVHMRRTTKKEVLLDWNTRAGNEYEA